MVTRFGWIAVSLAAWLLTAAQSRAQSALPVLVARPKQLKIDGDLGDFSGARFTRIGESDAGRAEVALAYDKTGLFIGARVFDDAFVRGDHPSLREDALVLRLGLPVSGSFETSELWLFAGRPGESPASAQLMAAGSKQPRPLAAPLRIVEGPADGGYALEAFVPWASLPNSADWLFARGALRLNDVDRSGAPARSVPAGPEKSGKALPWLVFDGGPIAAISSFTQGRVEALNAARLDFVGDVRGDARAEHVVVYDQYVLYGGSDPAFNLFQLPVQSPRDVRSAELRDLTGDRKPELIVTWREPAGADHPERMVWRVFDLRGDKPLPSFGIETQETTPSGSLECDVAVTKGEAGRPDAIRVKVVKSSRVSAANYSETPDRLSRAAALPPQILPLPLPWGTWLERVYAWDGQRFAVASERPNPKAAPLAPAQMPAPADPRASAPPQEASAGAPQAAFDAEALFARYRQARGAAAGSARFAQRADLAGDSRPESLALYGRECAIVGPGFRDGRDFFYFGLPVRDAPDVLDLSTRELTGDARQELVARVRQHIGDVTREILHVFTFAGESLKPVLAVEVGRTQAAHSIINKVSFVRERDHVVLHIAPGEARGWSAPDYPFTTESSDGIEPLLLPWKDKPLRYSFDGQRLQSRLGTD